MQDSTVTVGEFTYDPTTGEITGPAAYMRSTDFADWKRRFHAGNDPVFRVGVTESPSIEVAMLVSIQTNYAAWHGYQTMFPKEVRS